MRSLLRIDEVYRVEGKVNLEFGARDFSERISCFAYGVRSWDGRRRAELGRDESLPTGSALQGRFYLHFDGGPFGKRWR
jgi:hypothetical protein